MIGDKIKEIRKSQKITQKQLAEKIGVSAPTVTRYETGEIIPPIEKLINISKVFGLEIQDLIGNNHISLDCSDELISFLEYLGYNVKILEVPEVYKADLTEEATQDNLVINGYTLNNQQIERLEYELKECVEYFLKRIIPYKKSE